MIHIGEAPLALENAVLLEKRYRYWLVYTSPTAREDIWTSMVCVWLLLKLHLRGDYTCVPAYPLSELLKRGAEDCDLIDLLAFARGTHAPAILDVEKFRAPVDLIDLSDEIAALVPEGACQLNAIGVRVLGGLAKHRYLLRLLQQWGTVSEPREDAVSERASSRLDKLCQEATSRLDASVIVNTTAKFYYMTKLKAWQRFAYPPDYSDLCRGMNEFLFDDCNQAFQESIPEPMSILKYERDPTDIRWAFIIILSLTMCVETCIGEETGFRYIWDFNMPSTAIELYIDFTHKRLRLQNEYSAGSYEAIILKWIENTKGTPAQELYNVIFDPGALDESCALYNLINY